MTSDSGSGHGSRRRPSPAPPRRWSTRSAVAPSRCPAPDPPTSCGGRRAAPSRRGERRSRLRTVRSREPRVQGAASGGGASVLQVVHPPVAAGSCPPVRPQPELVLLVRRVHAPDVVLLDQRRPARAVHAGPPAVRPLERLEHVELLVVEPLLVPVRVVPGGPELRVAGEPRVLHRAVDRCAPV